MEVSYHSEKLLTYIGCPKKTVILSKIPITGLKRGLKIKVKDKNSGNFQSNEHRNFVVSSF